MKTVRHYRTLAVGHRYRQPELAADSVLDVIVFCLIYGGSAALAIGSIVAMVRWWVA